jgi:hypothetical protein
MTDHETERDDAPDTEPTPQPSGNDFQITQPQAGNATCGNPDARCVPTTPTKENS